MSTSTASSALAWGYGRPDILYPGVPRGGGTGVEVQL